MLKFFVSSIITLVFFVSFSQDIESDLFLHYPFNNSGEDLSSNGFDVQGSVAYNDFNALNQYATFDGSNVISSQMNVDNSLIDKVTISYWVRTTTITNALQVTFQAAKMGYGSYISTDGKLAFFFSSSSGIAYLSNNVLTDGLWHHVVGTNDGTTTTVYIDGEFDGTFSSSLTPGDSEVQNQIYFGNNDLNQYNFFGDLEEFRFYSRILDECEVGALYKHLKPKLSQLNFDNNTIDSISLLPLDVVSATNAITSNSALILDGTYAVETDNIIEPFQANQSTAYLFLKVGQNANEMTIAECSGLAVSLKFNPNSNKLSYSFDGITYKESSQTINIEQWYFVLIENNGSTSNLYIDNILDDTSNEFLNVGSNLNLRVGRAIANPNDYFTGSIAEIGVYDRIISECERDGLFNKFQEVTSINQEFSALNSSQIIEIYPNTFELKIEDNYSSAVLYEFDVLGRRTNLIYWDAEPLIFNKLNSSPAKFYLLDINNKTYSFKL